MLSCCCCCWTQFCSLLCGLHSWDFLVRLSFLAHSCFSCYTVEFYLSTYNQCLSNNFLLMDSNPCCTFFIFCTFVLYEMIFTSFGLHNGSVVTQRCVLANRLSSFPCLFWLLWAARVMSRTPSDRGELSVVRERASVHLCPCQLTSSLEKKSADLCPLLW